MARRIASTPASRSAGVVSCQLRASSSAASLRSRTRIVRAITSGSLTWPLLQGSARARSQRSNAAAQRTRVDGPAQIPAAFDASSPSRSWRTKARRRGSPGPVEYKSSKPASCSPTGSTASRSPAPSRVRPWRASTFCTRTAVLVATSVTSSADGAASAWKTSSSLCAARTYTPSRASTLSRSGHHGKHPQPVRSGE